MTKKIFSTFILMVLIAAMVLSFAACGSKDAPPAATGEKSFTFEVVDLDGSTETFDITTTEQYVGAALMAEGLVQGEDGPYGLYVKTVNGITYEYETHGCYWAFYVNGEYGMSGVDVTEIEDGATYSLRAEK